MAVALCDNLYEGEIEVNMENAYKIYSILTCKLILDKMVKRRRFLFTLG